MIKFKKILIAVFSTLCICMIAGILLLFLTLRFVSYSADTCAESAEELHNPYIGWYRIHNYMLSDTASYDLSEIRSQEHRAGLVLLEFNLKNYADRPITDQGLSLLDQVLESWQSTGRQLILRFFYDWEGNGNTLEAEPQDLSLILTHMSQTAEAVNRYSDCVYILQGIFIGPWGEMHSSRYATNEDMLTLANHLASVTDPEIFLAVRTPQQWRLLAGSTEPVSGSTAFNGSPASRLSLFNDGMLGSDTDLSTYSQEPSAGGFSQYEKSSRQDEIAFQDQLCAFVPNGGEVVMPNPYNDFSAAVRDLSAMHISYLNSAYDEAVFSKWRTETCSENSPYDGMNGFDYISRHLGYRYVLRSSECTSILPWEKNTELAVTLENTGFSNCYRPFDVSLTLKETGTNRTFTFPAQTDTRLWAPGEKIRLTFPVNIREYATGTYDVFLKISDPVSGSPVFLANDGPVTDDGHALGHLEIRISPW